MGVYRRNADMLPLHFPLPPLLCLCSLAAAGKECATRGWAGLQHQPKLGLMARQAGLVGTPQVLQIESMNQLIVFGVSLMWIAFCMRFWWVIQRENVWQRRLIAIAAGLGGGLIYIFGSMAMEVLHAARAQQGPAETEPPSATIRVQGKDP